MSYVFEIISHPWIFLVYVLFINQHTEGVKWLPDLLQSLLWLSSLQNGSGDKKQ